MRDIITANQRQLTQRTTKADDVLELLPIVDNNVGTSDGTRSSEANWARRG